MKKMKRIVPLIICMAAILSACGKEKAEETETPVVEIMLDDQRTVTADSSEKTEESDDASGSVEKETAESGEEAATAEKETAESDEASAPVEYETADGFMGSFLLASYRDLIDTTNEYGVLYRVVYKASIEGDELIACGSMDYRNFQDQDPITITSDITHIFKVDENTVYQMQGETELETISKEEFAGFLDSEKESGIYLEVEISDGVVKTASLVMKN